MRVKGDWGEREREREGVSSGREMEIEREGVGERLQVASAIGKRGRPGKRLQKWRAAYTYLTRICFRWSFFC